MNTLKWTLVSVLTLVLLAIGAGQAGWLQGRTPRDLGVRNGRLKAPSVTANSVSSQAALFEGHPMREAAQIAPLPLRGDAAASIAALRGLVEAMPGAHVVEQRGDYLYVQFTTRMMKYVDDTEFWADPQAGVVQVRSASRVGREDFGVNRERIESIRTAWQALAAPR